MPKAVSPERMAALAACLSITYTSYKRAEAFDKKRCLVDGFALTLL